MPLPTAKIGIMFCKTWTLSAFALVLSLHSYPCSRWGQVSNVEMVKEADVIVRAIAERYEVEPSWNLNTAFVPHSKVRFEVLEVIRGKTPANLTLPGYLSDNDDFNDRPSPYNFVRPDGRHGNCVANTYRSGAQFLLLRKKAESGDFMLNWYPLGPVNEQLHSTTDPWLLWVRAEAQKPKSVKSQ